MTTATAANFTSRHVVNRQTLTPGRNDNEGKQKKIFASPPFPLSPLLNSVLEFVTNNDWPMVKHYCCQELNWKWNEISEKSREKKMSWKFIHTNSEIIDDNWMQWESSNAASLTIKEAKRERDSGGFKVTGDFRKHLIASTWPLTLSHNLNTHTQIIQKSWCFTIVKDTEKKNVLQWFPDGRKCLWCFKWKCANLRFRKEVFIFKSDGEKKDGKLIGGQRERERWKASILITQKRCWEFWQCW